MIGVKIYLCGLMKKEFLKTYLSSEGGVTIIDVAIFMIVLGLIAAPLLREYGIYKAEKNQAQTGVSMAILKTAIDNYYFDNNQYPCPADPLLSYGDADYGFGERNTDGTCAAANLIRVQNTYADPTYNDRDGDGNNDAILVGAIPFKDLRVHEDQSIDAWGAKFTFVMSENLTREATFANPNPGVLLEDPNGVNSIIQLEDFRNVDTDGDTIPDTIQRALAMDGDDMAHYIIISHGPDRIGAIIADNPVLPSVAGLDCTVPSVPDVSAEYAALGLGPEGNRSQIENCDFDDTIFLDDGFANSDAAGIFYFDDIVFASNDLPAQLWVPEDDIDGDVDTSFTLIGIGTDEPAFGVDVNGNLLTDGGGASAFLVCDVDGTNCFDPDELGGEGIFCDENTAMIGIADADQRCSADGFVVTGTTPRDCEAESPGSFMTGFDGSGRIMCSHD